jgi:signal recognition particle GTPase
MFMAFRRPSSGLAERSASQPEQEVGHNLDPRPTSEPAARAPVIANRDWPSDETGLLDEVLRCHSLPEALLEQLKGLATAPVHAPRLVDRLAVALAAHFHFLPLDEAWEAPTLLYGMPGTGVSTLAAKLAAKFDEREILVISTDTRGTAAITELEENLEALALPLMVATDVAALRSIVATAAGRKVIIDAGCSAPTDKTGAHRLKQLVEASGAQGILVLSATAAAEEAASIARAASHIGTRRMIVTQLDTARYIGPALIAADTGKLAFVAASVTPHFAFGLRTLTPENLARRLMAAALKTERWRIAPL